MRVFTAISEVMATPALLVGMVVLLYLFCRRSRWIM